MNNAQPSLKDTRSNATWRKQLLARLAAERAYLLLQYRGLSAETVTAVSAAGDMTFKDVLLHEAAWGAFHTDRINLVRRNRSTELQPFTQEFLDKCNAELSEQFQAVPLEQVLAACLKERAGFLAELSRVSDKARHQRIPLPGSERARMRTWPRRLTKHQ